jgi:hypothetical protein
MPQCRHDACRNEPLARRSVPAHGIFGQIDVGSDALVSPEQPIGGSHTALVTVVYHVLDAASGPFGVRLKLPNPALKLPAGIRCRIEFRLQATRAE